MSLIDEAMEPCVIMDKVTVSDGEGGFETQWSEGATVNCAIVRNTTLAGQLMESQGIIAKYKVFTQKGISFAFHDVIKRLSDGQVFRITSEAHKTPISATLNLSQVEAERWVLSD